MGKHTIEFCRQCGHSFKIDPVFVLLASGNCLNCSDDVCALAPEEWAKAVIQTRANLTRAGRVVLSSKGSCHG